MWAVYRSSDVCYSCYLVTNIQHDDIQCVYVLRLQSTTFAASHPAASATAQPAAGSTAAAGMPQQTRRPGQLLQLLRLH